MLSRDVLIKLVSALPDEAIIAALGHSGIQVGDQMGGDGLAGMDAPAGGDDGPKSWGDLTLSRGPDDRPDMAKKDYLVDKLAMDQPAEMPHDSSGGDYAKPF